MAACNGGQNAAAATHLALVKVSNLFLWSSSPTSSSISFLNVLIIDIIVLIIFLNALCKHQWKNIIVCAPESLRGQKELPYLTDLWHVWGRSPRDRLSISFFICETENLKLIGELSRLAKNVDHLLLSSWLGPDNLQSTSSKTTSTSTNTALSTRRSQDGEQRYSLGFRLDGHPLYWRLSHCHQQGDL